MSDPLTLAREGIALAERCAYAPNVSVDEIDRARAALIAHAWQHYATLCRALLAAHEREAEARGLIEAIQSRMFRDVSAKHLRWVIDDDSGGYSIASRLRAFLETAALRGPERDAREEGT